MLTGAIPLVANFSRYMRSSALDNLSEDYIRTARSKGTPFRRVLSRHLLRNSLTPVVAMLGYQLPVMFGGALVIEQLFNYPGMGLLFWSAAQSSDFPVLLGCVLADLDRHRRRIPARRHHPVPARPTHARRHRMSFMKRFSQNRLAVVGLAILVIAILFVTIGPRVYPTDQASDVLESADLKPGVEGHPLGTDSLGYDVLGRLMVGGRRRCSSGSSRVCSRPSSERSGAIAGYVGGIVDAVMMRIVDAGIAIPAIFLLLVLSSIVQPSEWIMILVIGFVSWLVPARLVRAESLSVKTRDYVVAARAMGGSHTRIVVQHIVPNTIGTVVVNATFQVADAILLVAYVSFLGMGLQAPATMGAMLSDALAADQNAWCDLLPGIAIVVVCAELRRRWAARRIRRRSGKPRPPPRSAAHRRPARASRRRRLRGARVDLLRVEGRGRRPCPYPGSGADDLVRSDGRRPHGDRDGIDRVVASTRSSSAWTPCARRPRGCVLRR